MYSSPAFKRIHELAGRFEAFSHHLRLLADHPQCLLEEMSLVLGDRNRAGHGDGSRRMVLMLLLCGGMPEGTRVLSTTEAGG